MGRDLAVDFMSESGTAGSGKQDPIEISKNPKRASPYMVTYVCIMFKDLRAIQYFVDQKEGS